MQRTSLQYHVLSESPGLLTSTTMASEYHHHQMTVNLYPVNPLLVLAYDIEVSFDTIYMKMKNDIFDEEDKKKNIPFSEMKAIAVPENV
jgi:hypothetical protein